MAAIGSEVSIEGGLANPCNNVHGSSDVTPVAHNGVYAKASTTPRLETTTEKTTNQVKLAKNRILWENAITTNLCSFEATSQRCALLSSDASGQGKLLVFELDRRKRTLDLLVSTGNIKGVGPFSRNVTLNWRAGDWNPSLR